MKIGDLVKSAPWLVMPADWNRIGLVIELKPDEWYSGDNKVLVWWAADWQEWYSVRNLLEVTSEEG